MYFLQRSLLLFMLLGMIAQSHAQQAWSMFNYSQTTTGCKSAAHSEYAIILCNGKSLANKHDPYAPLQIAPDVKGKFSVFTIDEKHKEKPPITAIGFKVAIKDYDTHSLWMYSDETFYEVDIEDLLKQCKWGDKIIFIPVNRKHQLSKHEIVVSPGC